MAIDAHELMAAAGRMRTGLAITALAALVAASGPAGAPAAAQAQAPAPQSRPAPLGFASERWKRVPVRPGGSPDAAAPVRPAPPQTGRRRCIAIGTIAGAQLYGDRAIELTMKGGGRWLMYLAQECPALSFYQGFYYEQKQAGQLCAGRDVVGARSGGECAIAAIVPVKSRAKRRRRR